MADEKIRIEIELDDGSIKSGFARVKKNAKETGDSVDKSFSGGAKGVRGLIAPLAAAATAALALGAAFSLFRNGVSAAILQEQAVTNLNTSLRNAGTFSAAASQSFQDLASSIQATTRFGDEAILQQAALARNFTKTNEEAEKLTLAAVDLAEATGISLDSAVKNLGKSYAGLAGELGESLPAIRGLTQEQLKAGGAVQLVSDLFGGTAAENAKTFGQRTEQLGNAFGDFSEGIGFLITRIPVFSGLIASLKDFFLGAADGVKSFTDNAAGIAKINNAVVDFGQGVITFILAPLEQVFNIGRLVFNGLKTLSLALIRPIAQIGVAIFDFIVDPLKSAALGIAGLVEKVPVLGTALGTSLRAGVAGLDSLKLKSTEAIEKLDEVGASSASALTDSAIRLFEFPISEKAAEFTEQFRTSTEQVQIDLDKLTAGVKGSLGGVKKDTKKASLDIGAALGSGISKGVQNVISAVAAGENAFKALGESILGLLGDLAIQVGTFLITTGIGQIALQASPGGAVIAAGVGLVALGTVLKLLSGSGASAPAGATADGGGSTSPSFGGDSPALAAEPEVQDTTKVTVNVEGAVLDKVGTGLAIAEILQETFDTTGTKLVTT